MHNETMPYSDFKELIALYRQRYICGEIGDTAFREFLARNGYNATEIQAEISEATVPRNASALEWWRGLARDFRRR